MEKKNALRHTKTTTAGIPYLGIFTRISTLAVLDLANAIQT